jgi:hypothetical protein
MKRLLAGFIAGVILASASIAGAASGLLLHRHQTVYYQKIACVGESHGLICLKNRDGYEISYSRSGVFVFRHQRLVWRSKG